MTITDDEGNLFLQRLVARSRGMIAMNDLLARGRGDDDPVVLLLDPRARAMLAWYDRPGRITALMARAAEAGLILQVIGGLPRHEASRIAGGHLANLGAASDRLDADDGYHVVVVGTGGCLVEALPPVPE